MCSAFGSDDLLHFSLCCFVEMIRVEEKKQQHAPNKNSVWWNFFIFSNIAIEFFLNHCIAVTWVEHACKNSQLHTFLSCRKAGCRID